MGTNANLVIIQSGSLGLICALEYILSMLSIAHRVVDAICPAWLKVELPTTW